LVQLKKADIALTESTLASAQKTETVVVARGQ